MVGAQEPVIHVVTDAMRPVAKRLIPLALVATVASSACSDPTGVEEIAGWAIPAPALDLPPPGDGAIDAVYFAGGCFWGVEAVFEHVRGVVGVVSGYSGGTAESATYAQVSAGGTDHAESVFIRYDPKQVSYGTLLHVFFSVAHNATEVDQQTPDVGRQYRSSIFYRTDAERDVARAYIAQLDASNVLKKPIATRVDRFLAFYSAEDNHQNYLVRHTEEVYIVSYDMPKLAGLRKFFPQLYRPDPVGVGHDAPARCWARCSAWSASRRPWLTPFPESRSSKRSTRTGRRGTSRPRSPT
jgi:peptide-methionine (S)-S-oxide reductase